MHLPHKLEADSIRVTWCSCEKCMAMAPKSMTIIRNGRSRTIRLHSECCRNSQDDIFDMDA